MKKHILCCIGIACAVCSSAADKDPVLMTVAGKDVRLSEFKYLYNKNNNQQLEPLTIDRYVDMFVDYKLKVADAEAAGIDTTATFRTEYTQYRDELAKPYLRDNAVADSLMQEAYSHYADQVQVSHIMLPATEAGHRQADSLRTVITAGKLGFEDAARRFSTDRYSSGRGGRMGAVTPGHFPWAFEKAAYDTPAGQISEPVNSGFGWHLIRVESRQPAQGEVHAAHILRVTRGVSDAEAATARTVIDSIYAIAAANPDAFADLARKHSQDPGSGRRGGDLGWFGRGMMVQPFDSIAFAMPDSTVSAPFKTDFGWHIIYKQGTRKNRALDELRPVITKAMERDERANAPERVFAEREVTRLDGRIDEAAISRVAAALPASGALDSLLRTPAFAGLTAFTLGGEKVPFSAIAPGLAGVDASAGAKALRDAATATMRQKAVDAARDRLMTENPDYRNLVNEYRDGILLFDIANTKVWERAAKDTEGLNAFFEANRSKYAWDAPRFKSYVIFAGSDADLQKALEYAATLNAATPAAFTAAMQKEFGRKIKVERVIAAKGENAVTDYLGFGAPAPEAKSKNWEHYAAFGGKVIDAPETPDDVRAAVVADYQAALEAEWLKQLHKRYSVKINRKLLKKAF